MFKYKVTFKAKRQIDGWTDPANDLEYDTVSESITVPARNKDHARHVAVTRAYGWTTYIYPRRVRWSFHDIKSVTRIKRKK